MSKQKQSSTRNIRIGEWLVPYDDAPNNVVLERSIADVLSASPGDDGECMNSRCIKRHRKENIFPHPVYIVSTIKTRVYIVDQLDGKGAPAHAIRYELSPRDARLIAQHDSDGTGEPGELVLRVPSDPKGSPRRRQYEFSSSFQGGVGRDKKSNGSRTRKRVSHGAEARFKVAVGAGLIGDGSASS